MVHVTARYWLYSYPGAQKRLTLRGGPCWCATISALATLSKSRFIGVEAKGGSRCAQGTSLETHPDSRQHKCESRAFAHLARDLQLTAVTLHHVLDNRETQARTTGIARATAVRT